MAVRHRRNSAYQHHKNALCITMHTLDGSDLTPEAQAEAQRAIEDIAKRYLYVVNVTTT